VPARELLDDRYIANLRAGFNETKAKSVTQVQAGKLLPAEHTETSHLTLMDQEGNVIVTTHSINGLFGSALVAEGTGVDSQ
ncbi:unnamed protein product, partial [Sphagnum jensenii]